MHHERSDDMFDLSIAHALSHAADAHSYLDAPPEGDEPRKYLPCCSRTCGRIMRVPYNVISVTCTNCLRPTCWLDGCDQPTLADSDFCENHQD